MKIQLVFIPSPGIGHLRSTVELAKRLVRSDDRLWITVIIIPYPSISDDDVETTYIASLTTASQDRLNYEAISVANQPTDYQEPTQVYIEKQKPQVRDVVARIFHSTGVDSPRVAGFVVDMFCSSMIDVVNEFGVPCYMVYTSNATCLGITLHIQRMFDEKKYDVSELEDSVNELEFPFLTRPYPVKCLPDFFTSKDWLAFFLAQARCFRKMKEQKISAFAMVEELGLAVQIRKFFRGDMLVGGMEIVTTVDIERAVRCVMENDSEVRNRVKEMAEKCHVASMDGGSSQVALQKFIQDVTENVV
ncbi:glucosyltransferase-like protein [Arabidopsis thaliana]|jgi:hypothetical protein|eukprot:NP_001329277.1 glucosyltransferase-like protein [Arabidopsis thaliana]